MLDNYKTYRGQENDWTENCVRYATLDLHTFCLWCYNLVDICQDQIKHQTTKALAENL